MDKHFWIRHIHTGRWLHSRPPTSSDGPPAEQSGGLMSPRKQTSSSDSASTSSLVPALMFEVRRGISNNKSTKETIAEERESSVRLSSMSARDDEDESEGAPEAAEGAAGAAEPEAIDADDIAPGTLLASVT
eukprot:6689802-Prymnesium_polylepis.1